MDLDIQSTDGGGQVCDQGPVDKQLAEWNDYCRAMADSAKNREQVSVY
jgi:hypothetical protein